MSRVGTEPVAVTLRARFVARRRAGNVVFWTALCCLVAGCAARERSRVRPLEERECVLSDDNAAFLQRAIDEWQRGATSLLDVDAARLPRIVTFDRACEWDLDPDAAPASTVSVAVRFRGRAMRAVASRWHRRADGQEILAPDGARFPARELAFTSVYDHDRRPFLAFSLPDIWRLDPKAAADPRLDEIVLGGLLHEFSHTVQVVQLARRIAELRRRFSLPEGLNDDVVERRFSKDPAFAARIDEEIDTFFAAVHATRPEDRRALVRRALGLALARRRRYFVGSDAALAPLEDLFLSLEGVGTWFSVRLGHATEGSRGVTRGHNSWSQDEGLATMTLVEALVPGWRRPVLQEEAPPFQLLARATGAPWPGVTSGDPARTAPANRRAHRRFGGLRSGSGR